MLIITYHKNKWQEENETKLSKVISTLRLTVLTTVLL